MVKDLPEEWTNGTLNTLYVVDDLGLKKSGIPAGLRIKRKKGKTTSILYAEYLPSEEDDPRPFAGRTRNGEGRRITIESSLGQKIRPRQAERRLSGSWRTNAKQKQRKNSKSKTITTPFMPIGSGGSKENPASNRPKEDSSDGNGMSS